MLVATTQNTQSYTLTQFQTLTHAHTQFGEDQEPKEPRDEDLEEEGEEEAYGGFMEGLEGGGAFQARFFSHRFKDAALA